MMNGLPEVAVGGVLLAPFVLQAAIAVMIFALLRPLYRLVPVERVFSNPPLIGVCLLLVILAAVMVFM